MWPLFESRSGRSGPYADLVVGRKQDNISQFNGVSCLDGESHASAAHGRRARHTEVTITLDGTCVDLDICTEVGGQRLGDNAVHDTVDVLLMSWSRAGLSGQKVVLDFLRQGRPCLVLEVPLHHSDP